MTSAMVFTMERYAFKASITLNIVLIPKTQNPVVISEYRPISLLNSSIQLITKVLANILQIVILQVIHQNQNGFIKNRNI
jgi:hypothetical protein